MPTTDLIDSADPPETQLAKYRKITDSLMRRIERDTDQTGNAFSLFQRAVALEAEVRARTSDLQDTLADLNRVNEKLEVASAAAAEANRAKSRFLAAASHDVMQPLNAAKLFMESLGASGLDTAQRDTLSRIESALGSVEGILGSLLHISRLDTSEARAEVSDFPVSRILDVIRNEFEPLAAAHGVTLRTVGSSGWVCSDPAYLRQIVQNLVSNAIRYCEGGHVLLGCRLAGEALRIEVHDTGPGIAEADLPRIFEEFRQLRSGTNPGDGDGVGLGLAIVERACRLLDHRLHVRSYPGRGSVFAVSPPRASVEAESGEETDATLIALVVTRDTALAQIIEAMLESWQMVALVAASPEEASGIAGQLGVSPDVVVIDDPDPAAPGRIMREIGAPANALILLQPPETQTSSDTSILTLESPPHPYRLRAAIESIRARTR